MQLQMSGLSDFRGVMISGPLERSDLTLPHPSDSFFSSIAAFCMSPCDSTYPVKQLMIQTHFVRCSVLESTVSMRSWVEAEKALSPTDFDAQIEFKKQLKKAFTPLIDFQALMEDPEVAEGLMDPQVCTPCIPLGLWIMQMAQEPCTQPSPDHVHTG